MVGQVFEEEGGAVVTLECGARREELETEGRRLVQSREMVEQGLREYKGQAEMPVAQDLWGRMGQVDVL
jgi:hypothetical protein